MNVHTLLAGLAVDAAAVVELAVAHVLQEGRPSLEASMAAQLQAVQQS